MTFCEDTIKHNIKLVRHQVAEAARQAGRNPDDIRIMAVTKTHPADVVRIAKGGGISLFGENKVQEAFAKHPAPDHRDYELHMIGHLQKNKVKKAMEFFSMIQSVDSLDLAEEINKRAARMNVRYPVLIEFNIGEEKTKTGFLPREAVAFPEAFSRLDNLDVQGIMGIPPYIEDPEDTRPYFAALRALYEMLGERAPFAGNFRWLSMGMSHDFEVAVEEGATVVRIGTILFGQRIKE